MNNMAEHAVLTTTDRWQHGLVRRARQTDGHRHGLVVKVFFSYAEA